MNFVQYQQLVASGAPTGVDASLTVGDFNGQCLVNGFLPLKLTAVSPKYVQGTDIEVLLGTGKGTVFLLTSKGSTYTYNQASHLWAAAYLLEQTLAGATADNGNFRFDYYYLLVHKVVVDRYNSMYREGSSVWGGFTHPEEQPNPIINRVSQAAIGANPKLSLPTNEHKEAAFRSVSQSSSLDRYLGLYHLLELSFDYDLVEEIKSLNSDLPGIGKLLASHSQSEVDRLNRLISRYCGEITFLASILTPVFSNATYRTILEELLFDYSKDSNPYKKSRAQFMTASAVGFDEPTFKANKLEWNLEKATKLVTYVLYRFRCSIAHASIGEFIMTSAEESFVAEVAEPLIGRVLARVYSKQN